MATNLVSQIMNYLTPDIVSTIASYFGLDRSTTQKAIGASVPALLAGLVGLSSKPEGARQLSNVLSQQPSGIADYVRGLSSGSDSRTVTETGSGILSSLFGGSMFNSLAGAVGKFAGLGDGTSKSMLGLLGPLVLGSVAQQQRQNGLDAGGLANFLSSQKDNIAAAMPSGFGNILSGTGIMDSLGDTWRSGKATASAAAGRFAGATDEVVSDARRTVHHSGREARAASTGWLPWALGLLLLGGLAWWLMSQPGNQVVQDARTTAPVGQVAQNLTVGGVNVGNQVSAAINSMKTALQGISDTTSAQAALPRLQQAAQQLDSATGLATQLPDTGRDALASRVASEMPALDRDIDTVLSRPEIAAVVGSAVNGIRKRLNALSRG